MASIYRCAFCGREFLPTDAALFLAHMRICSNGGVVEDQQSDSSDSGSIEASTEDNTVAEADSRSEASYSAPLSIPRKRGRPPKNAPKPTPIIPSSSPATRPVGRPPKKPTVFLNRGRPPKKREVSPSSESTRSVSSVKDYSPSRLPDHTLLEAKKEILSGRRVPIVKIVTDPVVRKLIEVALTSGDGSAPLPSHMLSSRKKPSGKPHFKPKLKTVSGLSGSTGHTLPTGLTCTYCFTDGFRSLQELNNHRRVCEGTYQDNANEDEDYKPSRKSGSTYQLSAEEGTCKYCLRQFNSYYGIKRHLSENCAVRRHYVEMDQLPDDDQLKLVEAEIHNRKHNKKEYLEDQEQKIAWICEYCKSECLDRNDLLNHLRKCDSRLQLIADDELLAPEDQYNRVKKMPPPKGSVGLKRPSLGTPKIKEPKTPKKPLVEEGETECKICHKTFKNTFSLRCHVNLCRSERVNCPQCKKEFMSQHTLNLHLRHCDGSRTFTCPQCNKQFSSNHTKRAHMMNVCKILEPQERSISSVDQNSVCRTEEDSAVSEKVQCKQCGAEYDSGEEHACSPQPILEGYQGEQGLYFDDGIDHFGDLQRNPDELLEELSEVSPLDEDLLAKINIGEKLEISPPPLCLANGVQLVEVYDSDNRVFQIPFDTSVDAESAMADVIASICRRQRMINQQIQKPYTDKLKIQNEDLAQHKAPNLDGNGVVPGSSEAFIASADWIRRQNETRRRTGARRVKASTRYIE